MIAAVILFVIVLGPAGQILDYRTLPMVDVLTCKEVGKAFVRGQDVIAGFDTGDRPEMDYGRQRFFVCETVPVQGRDA